MFQHVLWWERQKRCSCRKKQGPMAKKYCYNKILMVFLFWGREDEDKRRRKNGQTSNFFSELPFLDIYYKKSAHSLYGAWSFLFVHIQFTPSEGPKGFVNCFFFYKKIRPWKLDHEKRPSFHGPTSWSML